MWISIEGRWRVEKAIIVTGVRSSRRDVRSAVVERHVLHFEASFTEGIDYELGLLNVNFKAAPTACESCHDNPHATQFAGKDGVTRCARCHNAMKWRPSLFDHETTKFPLKGAHHFGGDYAAIARTILREAKIGRP